ncbi:hypothetical protein JTB14_011293 [Gonioctena quinquepunctata]|nr:hypothetical protein JTB14_011293 [Gonioctena quinquepunctata]
MFPYKGHCEHSVGRYFSKKSYFAKEPRWNWLSYTLGAFLISVSLFNLYLLPGRCSGDRAYCLVHLVNEIDGLFGFVVYSLFLGNGECYSASANLWCDILEERRLFHFEELLTTGFCRKFRLKWLILKYSVNFGYVIILCCFGILQYVHGFDADFSTRIMFVWVTITELSLVLAFMPLNWIIVHVLGGIFRDVIQENIPTDLDNPVGSFERTLKRHIHLISLSKIAFKRFNEFVTTNIIMIYSGVVIALVSNIYLFMTPVPTHLYFYVKFLQTRTVFLIIASLLLILSLSNYEHLNEDVLSYLFRYPISKLTPREAAQMEMLVSTLTLQKPVVTASYTMTVSKRLLASVSGSVLTYVLVALQFRAAWTKD